MIVGGAWRRRSGAGPGCAAVGKRDWIVAKILVVDDDAHVGRVMSMWLSRHGHEVTIARHGAEALEHLGQQSIDLVISDMNMPVMDGLALAKAVRERGRDELPFVLLTARCDQDALTEQLSRYRINVYPKPFFPSKLVAEINRLLGLVPATP